MTVALGGFIRLTLLVTMLALGLGLRPEGLRRSCGRLALILRVLLGSCLLVPLVGLLLLQMPWSFAIGPVERTAIALMALCPSAPLALRKARRVGGDPQLAALMQVGAALLAMVTLPLLAIVYQRSLGLSGWDIRPHHVALQVLQVQVLPLLLALALRQRWPQLADRLADPLARLADGLLALLVLLVLIRAAPRLLVFLPANLPALLLMVLLAAAALLIGLAMAGGSGHGSTAALVTALRNPGLALLFAGRDGQELPGLRLAVLVYLLVTLLVTLVLNQPLRRRQRRAPP
jgi:bile acid:Na+ symporter, BASS family